MKHSMEYFKMISIKNSYHDIKQWTVLEERSKTMRYSRARKAGSDMWRCLICDNSISILYETFIFMNCPEAYGKTWSVLERRAKRSKTWTWNILQSRGNHSTKRRVIPESVGILK